MRIAVMGAGAVGCYYGGMLARAGHAVTLIGRPQHVDAVSRHGLNNALSAISQLPYGRLVQGEGLEAVMRDVVQECLAVAQREGVTVPGDVWQAVQRLASTMPTQFLSTAQDLSRGKRSEIDHLNGYVLRRGEALGIATPVNRVLHALVKLLEGKSCNDC